jgi:hypothetical protein
MRTIMKLSRGLFVGIASATLCGCLSLKLKQLEINQLNSELSQLEGSRTYFATQPKLDQDYGAEAFISADSFNRFLTGMDNYSIPIPSPSGATVKVLSTRLSFSDGAPSVEINALGSYPKYALQVKLRVRAELDISADSANKQLIIGFRVKEILPDIRLSIFRWHEFWFAIAILRLEAQQYVNSLPQVTVPLAPAFAIDLPQHNTSRSGTCCGYIDIMVSLPDAIHLQYGYRVLKAVTLQDGLHVFFSLERGAR